MPILKSAKKALRKDQRQRIVNLSKIKKLKSALKQANLAIKKKSKTAPQKTKEAIVLLDKAAKIHLIHKNKAARLKSKLTIKFFQTGMAFEKHKKGPAPKQKIKPKIKVIKKTKAKTIGGNIGRSKSKIQKPKASRTKTK